MNTNIKYIIVFLFISVLSGCGADTEINPNQAANITQVKIVEFYETNTSKWGADIQVIFSQPPRELDVQIESSALRRNAKWQQNANIMTLSIILPKIELIGYDQNGMKYTLRNYIKQEKKKIDDLLTYEVSFILDWITGRKPIDITIKPPRNIAELITETVFDINVIAAFASADPADGGSVASNGSIKVTFDKNPGEVMASTGTVSGAGTSRTISGPFDVGALELTVTWTNGDGSQTLNYTITEADETPPEVVSSNPEHDAENLDPAKVFEDGITVTFSESVTGTLKLMDGDTDVGWTSSAEGDTITLIGNAGQELRNETEYTVMGTVEDASGNTVDVEITFTTKAKE